MTTETSDLQEKWAEKIALILRKAESTTPEEAETLVANAQRLMAKWSIERTMLARLTDKASEPIVEKKVFYHGSYCLALYDIGAAIAHANDCKILQMKQSDGKWIFVLGFESDVDQVLMLDASLQIQAQVALRAAEKNGELGIRPWMSGHDRWRERRTFLFGFASGLRDRLRRAAEAGRKEYVVEHVEQGEDEQEVATGMELVVRSRKDKLNDWYDEHYGKLKAGRDGYVNSGSSSSRAAGRAAGLNADTGSAGRIKSRKELGR